MATGGIRTGKRPPGVRAAAQSRRKEREEVRRMLAQTLASVEGLQKPIVQKLIPILSQAQNSLERDLRAWLAKQGGDLRFTTQRYRNALVAIRNTLETIKRLQPTLAAELRIGSRTAGQLATRHLEEELARFGKVFEGTIQPIALDEAIILARQDKLLLARHVASARRYTGKVRSSIVDILALSRLRGESIDELIKRLERHGGPAGLFKKQTGWAERLARTETMNAYNVAHHEGLVAAHEEDDEIRMRWDASFDRRRCPICRSLDGETVDVDKEFAARWEAGGRPQTSSHKHPPAHPNCRCVLVPWKDAWPDETGWPREEQQPPQ